MRVKIHDLSSWDTYTVSCEAECRDEVDKSAYRSAVESGGMAQVGKTIAEFLTGTEDLLDMPDTPDTQE